MRRMGLIVIAGLLFGGCLISMAKFDDKGLRHEKCDLAILFTDGKDGIFINEQWMIDGWEITNRKPADYKRMDGHPSEGRIYLDIDGNRHIMSSL